MFSICQVFTCDKRETHICSMQEKTSEVQVNNKQRLHNYLYNLVNIALRVIKLTNHGFTCLRMGNLALTIHYFLSYVFYHIHISLSTYNDYVENKII